MSTEKNAGHTFHGLCPSCGARDFEPYHLTYFTPKSLRQVLSKAGFDVQQSECPDSFSGWFLAILRTLLGFNRDGEVVQASGATGRWSRSQSRVPLIEHGYRLAMVSAGVLTWPWRKLQTLFGHGDEIIVVVGRGEM